MRDYKHKHPNPIIVSCEVKSMETEKTHTQAEVDALLAEKDARIAELEKKKLAILAEIDEVTAAIKSRDDEAGMLKQQLELTEPNRTELAPVPTIC